MLLVLMKVLRRDGYSRNVALMPEKPNPLMSDEAKLDTPPLMTPQARPMRIRQCTLMSMHASSACFGLYCFVLTPIMLDAMR